MKKKQHINKANVDIFLRWNIPEDTFKASRDTNQYEELKSFIFVRGIEAFEPVFCLKGTPFLVGKGICVCP